ncbi:putative ABC multidrug transporter [Clavulina sp. PMI_390]|nr:putative ABC multidrug transporter [Clavulina sp. PMI_390]
MAAKYYRVDSIDSLAVPQAGENSPRRQTFYSDITKAASGLSLDSSPREKHTQSRQVGYSDRRLDVAWKDLWVRGVGATAVYGQTMGSIFNPVAQLRDKRRVAALEARLRGFNGVLKSGEMALVVGRPGSGCTTFLKTLANFRDGFAGIDGEVFYGNMDAKEAKKYPGQIVFNGEDDVHYPVLTTPSAKARSKGVSAKRFQADFEHELLRSFDIGHTRDTLVGNEYIRGVSGGERKRVSLTEVLVNRAPVILWDSPSRGLDASTALEYVRTLRAMTDSSGLTTLMSLYQAGNQIYELFDKVMVIAAGYCIYWGPLQEARPYFEKLGFECPPGQNISDYLTGVTVSTERKIFDAVSADPARMRGLPLSPEEFLAAYEKSDIARRMRRELEDHLSAGEARAQQTDEFKESVRLEKERGVWESDPSTVNIWTQIKAATTRQYQLMWNDKASIVIKQGSSTALSIILGSLFYNLQYTTADIFTRSGTVFFILLFNALLGMTEVTASFGGRSILAKHKSFALFHPSSMVLAQVLADLPILVFQVTTFMLPIYFMANLKRTAAAFFTLWTTTYVTTLALTAFFRMVGFSFSTFDGASGVAGVSIGLLILYAGYLIPQPSMKPWLSWIRWLNPLFYGFEAALTNDFHNVDFSCVQIIPSGGPYSIAGGNFACAVKGAQPGQTFVNGDAYLNVAMNYHYSHLWRNVWINVVFWIVFVFLTAVAVGRLKAAGSEKSFLLFSRQAARNAGDAIPMDPEHGQLLATFKSSAGQRGEEGTMKGQLQRTNTVFTWQNVNYTVPVKGGQRQLLNDVQGYARPGQLLALMGSSGAGKSTLLDTLSLRKETGVVEGKIMIDGRPLGASFQRTTAYVAQMDVHDPNQTVREALVFSALLRQPREIPKEEKLAYVDTVLDMLDLHEIADALIGVPGAGLGIEQRKRVTIGVELVSKPVLLFLDEPTSGLDGQSSFKIVHFLRKLADAGQCIICTIHQPSALLFYQFDQLLLLAKGGNTVYMGPLGHQGRTMVEYFERNGINCPPDANPAEFMIDVVSGPLAQHRDWAEVWRNSPEQRAITAEVCRLAGEAASQPPSYHEDGREFATTLSTQLSLVVGRAHRSLWRSPEYLMARIVMIIGTALMNGFSFLQIDNSVASLQTRLFCIFNGMWIAPGLLVQLQIHFIQSRNVFEAREKLSKMYGWFPFVVAEVVSEAPWLVLTSVLFYALWYFAVFPVGISTNAYHAGLTFAMLLIYQLFILGFGQTIAACAGNETQATLINPAFLAIFASFSGVLVPYGQITAFWRYWLYYINPWSYLLGGQVFFSMRDIPVVCTAKEYAVFSPPMNQTCGEYMAPFFQVATGYINNPNATSNCQYCEYSIGNEYLAHINLENKVDGPRDIGISALYMIACFGFLCFAMWFRSRPKKNVMRS